MLYLCKFTDSVKEGSPEERILSCGSRDNVQALIAEEDWNTSDLFQGDSSIMAYALDSRNDPSARCVSEEGLGVLEEGKGVSHLRLLSSLFLMYVTEFDSRGRRIPEKYQILVYISDTERQ